MMRFRRTLTLSALLLTLTSISAPAYAQLCSGMAPSIIPQGVYADEWATFEVVGTFGGLQPGNVVTWRFQLGTSVLINSSAALRSNSGAILASSSVRTNVPGFLTVLAQVDGTGISCEMGTLILDPPEADIVSITGTRQVVEVLTFTAAVGVDGSRISQATYNWDFGDGDTAQGQTVQHAYNGTGTFTVRLTVSDSSRSDTTSQNITISTNPNVPNALRNISANPMGCIDTNNVRYWVSWSDGFGGPSPTRYELDKETLGSFRSMYRGTATLIRDVTLTKSSNVTLRARGCLNSASSSCGPYIEYSFLTPPCDGGGGRG